MKREMMVAAICGILLFILIAATIVVYQNSCYGWSSKLVEAIRRGDTDAALELIDKGVAREFSMDTYEYPPTWLTNMCEMWPETPLRIACNRRNYAVAERLLQEGASATGYAGARRLGRTPVFEVILRPYSPVDLPLLQLLHEYGAGFEYEKYDGYPIIEAVTRSCKVTQNDAPALTPDEISKGIAEVFLYIAEHTDCYVLDGGKRNALHNAALYNNWYLCRILAEDFAFPLDAVDFQGNTAYDHAVKNDAPEEILLLLEP